MLLTLDSSSAGVFAGVFSTLLIAIALQNRVRAEDEPSRLGRALIVSAETVRLCSVLAAVLSIGRCLTIVARDSTTSQLDSVFITVTLYLIMYSTATWAATHFLVSRARFHEDH